MNVKKFKARFGKNLLKNLEDERTKMIIRRDSNLLLLSPRYKKTYEYAHINLAIEFWTLKIEMWKTILGDK